PNFAAARGPLPALRPRRQCLPRDPVAPRSQALPGNALAARLCLADRMTSGPRPPSFANHPPREAEPPGSRAPRRSLGTRGMSMKFGITFDLKTAPLAPGAPDDAHEEFDSPHTIEAIAAVLRDLGHQVVLLGDGRAFIEQVLIEEPDFVFNFAEGHG